MSKNKLFIKRKSNSHKGDYGKVLVIAGSPGMLGAGVLATRAALRAGSGLVYWAVPKELKDAANIATPEVIVLDYDQINGLEPDVVAIGPGVGRSKIIHKLLHSLVIKNMALVIDADAINVLSQDIYTLQKSRCPIILTPHPGEMSRLTGISVARIQSNREQIASEYAVKWNAIIVLKGEKTVVAAPNGKKYINSTGNPGMATAGMGDALTGIIASFIGQKIPIFEAVCKAVYIHGLAGDFALKEFGECGMIASDLIDKIPKAILKAGNVQ